MKPRHAVFISELPARIKWLREKAKLSQEKLAEAIGVSRPFIALIESGARTPSIEILGKIMDALSEKAGVRAANRCWYGGINGRHEPQQAEQPGDGVGGSLDHGEHPIGQEPS